MTQGYSRSRFVSNTAALGASTVLATLFTFAQVKLLAAFLSLGTFGLFAALRGLSLLVSMIAANGLPQLLVRFLPVHEAHGEGRRAYKLSAACALVAAGAAVVLVALVHALRSTFLSSVPTAEMTPEFEVWFYATTIGVTLKLILYGGLNGLRRLTAQTWLESTSLFVQLAWIFTVREHLDLTVLFRILGTVSLVTVVVGWPWYARRLRADVGATSDRGTGAGAQGTPSYGSYWLGAAGLSVVAMGFTDVDRYILSSVLALELLSLFHVGSRILRLASRLMSIPVLAFQPEVSRLDAEGRGRDVEISTRIFLKFNIATSVFISTGLIVFAPDIIRLVANEAYLPARPLLVLLAVSLPLTAMTAPITAVMKALDQVRRAFYCDLAWVSIYVVALLLLGRRYGLVGAGLAHLSACAVQLVLADRLSRVRFARVIPSSLGRSLVACAVAYAPTVAAGWIPASHWVRLGTRLALLALGLWLFRRLALALGVLGTGERERLLTMVGGTGMQRILRRVLT